ncbi:MAG: type IX secretion system membrane protein PorP/SprF [Chlorobi bacterium]|nr:type IX secretion system membrane protein PorP/SprF [Chlorobiota bacterium]
MVRSLLNIGAIITLLATGHLSIAQDIHTSIPTAWVPAYLISLTGATNNNLRGGIGYGAQWREYVLPYRTTGVFGDVSLGRNNPDHWMAIGLNIIYDEASPFLKWTKISVQTAFHWYVSNRSSMGVAVGLGYNQRRFQWSDDLWTESQITPNGPVTTLPSQETMNQQNISYIVLQAGLIWLHTTFNEIKIALGTDAAYLNGIKESFIYSQASPKKRIRIRYLAHLEYPLSDFSSIMGTLYGQLQGKATEVLLGLMYQQVFANRYVSGKEKRIGGGIWLRAFRSVAPAIVLGFEQFSLWLSYDVWFASVKNDIGWRGGIEVVARIDYPLGYFNKGSIVCPRF